MKSLKLIGALLCCLAFLILSAQGEMREWETADGAKTLLAEYVRSGDGSVTIRRKRDGKDFTLSLDKLSEADQEWVKKKEAEAPVENGGGGEADAEFAKLITGDWERTEGHDLKYRVYGARKLRRAKGEGYPLVVYLHGKGGDVMSPEEPGVANIFTNRSNYRKRGCFLVVPQNPDQKGWNGATADNVVKIIKEMITKLPVDKKRIYLTGYSMGGFGTFHLLAKEPELFAAGIPVAGGGNPSTASKFKNVAVWVFHGAKDNVVNVKQSRNMVEALKKARGNVKYTEDPEGNHGIAGKVYADKEVHEWMFAQKRE
jgi:predicted peptidase